MTAAELKSFRLDLGMTRNEFAKQIGYSAKTVESWEYGVSPIKSRVELMIKSVFKKENR